MAKSRAKAKAKTKAKSKAASKRVVKLKSKKPVAKKAASNGLPKPSSRPNGAAGLKRTLGVTDEQRDAWYQHWVSVGFAALEIQLATDAATGLCCHGATRRTLADICLVPQVANARRSNVSLAPYPTLERIDAHCRALPAFAAAAPDRQPDAA